MFPTDLTSVWMLAHKAHILFLKFTSWLVNLYEGDLLTRSHPLSSARHSSFIIKEVPGVHKAVVCLLLFCRAVSCSTCFVDMNGWVASKALRGEVVAWKGMLLKKSACTLRTAISILSRSLLPAAAARTQFPGPTLNSCSPHLSVKPSLDSGISFIPSCWI